jgi:recombinational DNA repair protein RecR
MYTPQFSPTATVTVRRLAWALGISMPKAVDKIIKELPALFSPSAVCPLCKDSTKCKLCAFYQSPAEKAGTENAA